MHLRPLQHTKMFFKREKSMQDMIRLGFAYLIATKRSLTRKEETVLVLPNNAMIKFPLFGSVGSRKTVLPFSNHRVLPPFPTGEAPFEPREWTDTAAIDLFSGVHYNSKTNSQEGGREEKEAPSKKKNQKSI